MTRILLLGATGYTGSLTARRLVDAGGEPMLLGRDRAKLDALASSLKTPETRLVDVTDPDSLRQVIEPGDVLVSTVGPFLEYGRTAVSVAAEIGAHYVDSSGEGPFIREVFDRWGPLAATNSATLIPSCAWDFVPGALAGSLAIDALDAEADSVDITYFTDGFQLSGGTQASVARVPFEPGYTFTNGAITAERVAKHIGTYRVDGRQQLGVSVPAAEHFGLPQSYPKLRNVTVRMGYPTSARLPLMASSHLLGAVTRIPPLARMMRGLAGRRKTESTGGPDASARSTTVATVIATATSTRGETATVTLRGPDPYDVTADLLTWAATQAAAGRLLESGACGPVFAFGRDAVRDGCARAGITVEDRAT